MLGILGTVSSRNSGLGGHHRRPSRLPRHQSQLISGIGYLLHRRRSWTAEVDRFCDLDGELALRGYAGIWKMRTGNAADGCAIFWRTYRFQLLHEEHIEFNKLGLRDNVAQICVLEVRVLLDQAYAVSRVWNDALVIVCGDFNSTPMDYTGTKDSCREPQVTSYNRRFMGTVDYIWCSEDLQTVKVLNTRPKHVLQRTPGFLTQKWGSDHIALACELAFPVLKPNRCRCLNHCTSFREHNLSGGSFHSAK